MAATPPGEEEIARTACGLWRASHESGTPCADRQRGNTKDEDPSGLRNDGFRHCDLDAQI